MKTKSSRVLIGCAVIGLLSVVNALAWTTLTDWASDPNVFMGFAGVNGNGDAGTIGQYNSANSVLTTYSSWGKRISDGTWEDRHNGSITSSYVLEYQLWDHTVYNDVFSTVSNTYGNAGGRAVQ